MNEKNGKSTSFFPDDEGPQRLYLEDMIVTQQREGNTPMTLKKDEEEQPMDQAHVSATKVLPWNEEPPHL